MRELDKADKADKANDAACKKVDVERPGTGHIYSESGGDGLPPSRMETGTRDQNNHHGLSDAAAPSSNVGWFQLVSRPECVTA